MFKKITIAAVIALSSVSAAQANDPCHAFGYLAGSVMEARQSGVDMSDMMAIIAAEGGPAVDVARLMVIEAYGKPRYRGAEMIQREIEDFKNDAMLACYVGVGR
jgi:hypothetical protein